MPAAKKRPKNRKLKPAPMRPGSGRSGQGGLLRTGNPGNRGGGRTPDEFKKRMREIASSEAALKYLEECIHGDHGPKAAASARAYATERGYGKVPMEVRGDLTARVLVVSDLEQLPSSDE